MVPGLGRTALVSRRSVWLAVRRARGQPSRRALPAHRAMTRNYIASPAPGRPSRDPEPGASPVTCASWQSRERKIMSRGEQKVAVVTGSSHGIGAGLVDAYRQRGWAVVANSRTIKPSGDPNVLTVGGAVSRPTSTDRSLQ